MTALVRPIAAFRKCSCVEPVFSCADMLRLCWSCQYLTVLEGHTSVLELLVFCYAGIPHICAGAVLKVCQPATRLRWSCAESVTSCASMAYFWKLYSGSTGDWMCQFQSWITLVLDELGQIWNQFWIPYTVHYYIILRSDNCLGQTNVPVFYTTITLFDWVKQSRP